MTVKTKRISYPSFRRSLETVPFGTLARNTFAIMLDHSYNVDEQDNANESGKNVVQYGNTKICQNVKIRSHPPQNNIILRVCKTY